MIRRFVFLLFVAGTSGMVGMGLGVLVAPAPGAETRASLAAFFDEHDETIADYYDRGREALDHAVDAVDAAVSGPETSEDRGGGETDR